MLSDEADRTWFAPLERYFRGVFYLTDFEAELEGLSDPNMRGMVEQLVAAAPPCRSFTGTFFSTFSSRRGGVEISFSTTPVLRRWTAGLLPRYDHRNASAKDYRFVSQVRRAAPRVPAAGRKPRSGVARSLKRTTPAVRRALSLAPYPTPRKEQTGRCKSHRKRRSSLAELGAQVLRPRCEHVLLRGARAEETRAARRLRRDRGAVL